MVLNIDLMMINSRCNKLQAIKALQKSNNRGASRPKKFRYHNKIYNLLIKVYKFSIYLGIEAMIAVIM